MFNLEIFNNRYLRDLKKNKLLMLTISALLILWSVIYITIFYKPSYISNAKVLIKDAGQDSFVTEFGDHSFLKPLTSGGNPLLTQIELLKSKQLEKRLTTFINEKYPKKSKRTFNSNAHIKVKIKPATDILNIGVQWGNAKEAQDILIYTLKEFKEINISIANKLKKQRREYIDTKIIEIQDKLKEVREKIKSYKTANYISDLDLESQKIVSEKLRLTAEIEDTNVLIIKTNALIKEYEGQLNLDITDALSAVALGGDNLTLRKLRENLQDANQQYQFDIIKYADTNPKIVALKNKIDTINNQIKNQIELSIGKYAQNNNGVRIYDSVRKNIIKDLVVAQSKYISLIAKKKAIENSLNKIKNKISKFPEIQFIMSGLKQEEKTLADAYSELRSKQIEAKIQEAEAVSNISVIDMPSLPMSLSFPSRLHILILSIITGIMFALLSSFIKTYIEDVCEEIEYIEKTTGISILGVIPWLDKTNYHEDKSKFMKKIAYNNIISNLMVRCYKNDANVLTFTSTSIKKPHSTIMNNIAEQLNKLGHSVIIVDTDFRMPGSHVSSSIIKKVDINFSDLIIYVENHIKKKTPYKKDHVTSSAVKDEKGIFHLLNGDSKFEPYEFFGTAGYNAIIHTLKETYDWVLIDTAAAHISPEFSIISKQSDGIIVFVNRTATYSSIKSLTRSLKLAEVPIIGTIIRKKNNKLEKDYETYLAHQYEKLKKEVKMEKVIDTLNSNISDSFAEIDENSKD